MSHRHCTRLSYIYYQSSTDVSILRRPITNVTQTRYRTITTSSTVSDRRLKSAWPNITGDADITPVIVQLTENTDSVIAQLPIWHRQHNVQTTSLSVSLSHWYGEIRGVGAVSC